MAYSGMEVTLDVFYISAVYECESRASTIMLPGAHTPLHYTGDCVRSTAGLNVLAKKGIHASAENHFTNTSFRTHNLSVSTQNLMLWRKSSELYWHGPIRPWFRFGNQHYGYWRIYLKVGMKSMSLQISALHIHTKALKHNTSDIHWTVTSISNYCMEILYADTAPKLCKFITAAFMKT
jgi:hypothetical protein